MVLAERDLASSREPGPTATRPRPVILILAAAAFAVAVAGYAADVAAHPLPMMLSWFDLRVYYDAGVIVRHAPARLYLWQFRPGIRFTYTPFAALCFATVSMLPWQVLAWLMTVASIIVLVVTAWLTFGALAWAGPDRAAAVLAVSAAGLWTEPVQRALHLGQIELLLMAMLVWDLCQPDRRWWKGAAIGVAAGIKLVPLIFIPYLLLAGKLRQAAVATAAFAVTALVGFAALPHPSAQWWLTGYFLSVGRVGHVAVIGNQSLLAMIARAYGGVAAATPLWLAAASATGLLGIAAAAILHRAGRPVYGWVTCALTGLLVSPISWNHHWVWIVPIMAVAVTAAVRARGAARAGYWALAGALAVVFGAWPVLQATGPQAFIPRGLTWLLAADPHPNQHVYGLHGIQVISWNLFVLAGLAMLGVAVIAALRVILANRADEPDPAERPPQQPSPELAMPPR
jgi:alpha-1,2-mannosyltransferase